MSFSAGIRRDRNISYVTAVNSKTGVRLPITGCEHLHSKEEIIDWLQRYPSLVPNDYDRKVERLKHMKNLRYKTIPGDIFRVEIDLLQMAMYWSSEICAKCKRISCLQRRAYGIVS